MTLSSIIGTKILVLGDIMLDKYQYGRVDRISPEAPVPVFKPLREKSMLGGVGNVAANLAALGCSVQLVSRTGRDAAGKAIADLTDKLGIDASYFHQPDCPTTVKTRFIAGNNHLFRIDTENVCPLNKTLTTLIESECVDVLDETDVVLLSDYAKGLLSEELCHSFIAACSRRGKMVIVDPKGSDYTKYAGVFLVKPNLKELAVATGKVFDASSPKFLDQVTSAARSLAKKLNIRGMLVTLSENGMVYVPTSTAKPIHLPTKAQEVFDVSGAGDTALAALGAALGAGFDMTEAMRISNAASGVVVGKLGTATVSIEEIETALSDNTPSTDRKIVSAEAISDLVKRLKNDGKKIGFTNGCFDCCHLGHLRSLQEAKTLCDILIVGVNSDSWIRKHKGADRPIQDELTRTALLASLEFVDYVIVFDSATALPLVRRIRPDVIAKEGYALKDWPEGQFVRSTGGEAVVLKRIDGHSTSSLAAKMKSRK